MKFYTDLDGRRHFIGSRPYSNMAKDYIPSPIIRLLKFGMSMKELMLECIHFRCNSKNGVCDASTASSAYNSWFRMGLIYWGEDNEIYLSNW